MPEKILIVDDHADTVDMLQLVLRDAGYAVRSARNAEEAYRKAQTFVPDLLLLDLMLPDLNAYELMDRLRNAPATARTPMMVMTGLPGELPQVLATNAAPMGGTDRVQIAGHYCALRSALFSAASISSQDGARQRRTSSGVPDTRTLPSQKKPR